MRVTTLVVQPTIWFLSNPSPSPSILLFRQPPPLSVRVAFSSSSEQEGKREAYKVPTPKREWVAEWVRHNDEAVRQMPIWVGAISLLAVLINRAISGIAPVSNASSSQSRADILTLALAVTCILNGLVWLSIRPKYVLPVIPEGVECKIIYPDISERLTSELLWFWESLSNVTCCRSLIVVYNDTCLLQAGIAATSSQNGNAIAVDPVQLLKGSLCQGVIRSGTQSFLANLSLYPGRSDMPFLPSNTQSVILQPLGERGVAIIGGDIIRGFTRSDQAWISLISDKLESTLSKDFGAVEREVK